MSEKRFELVEAIYNEVGKQQIEIMDNLEKQILDKQKIADLLNEQQEVIEELHTSDEFGWRRAEKFEKELKQKKIYIKRLEYKVQKFKEMNGEQQATINLLLELLQLSEEIVISEFSSHIDEDLDKLDKLFKKKDIKEIEKYVRGCDV